MKNCNGKCVGGAVIAIIFGALFLWTLVATYKTHSAAANLWDYNVLAWYGLAMVFLTIAKVGKSWGMGCSHCQPEAKK